MLQAAAATASPNQSLRSAVLSTYRILLRYSRTLEDLNKRAASVAEVRDSYHTNLSASPDSAEQLVDSAVKRIAFLRMSTPKADWLDRGLSSRTGEGQNGEMRWVYRSDGKEEGGKGTAIKTRQVISNWDGKNLDPCSVKTHSKQLKRARFVNNAHAKGIF